MEIINKKVILDPTGFYEPLTTVVLISNEVEWLRHFFREEKVYWVKGKHLCAWAKEWLWVRNYSDYIVEEKLLPQQHLARYFQPYPIPLNWDELEILHWVKKLDSIVGDDPIVQLLSNETGETDIWVADPSIKHLAQWLSIEVPTQLQPFEHLWQEKITKQEDNTILTKYYKCKDKLSTLRCWLGISEPIPKELGVFPLIVPGHLQMEFDQYWEHRILESNGEVLDLLDSEKQSGMARIATIYFDILKQQPTMINSKRRAILARYLDHRQKTLLAEKEPPQLPPLFPINGQVKDVLKWVTEWYLPFRQWECSTLLGSEGLKQSEKMAEFFVNWILASYPQLKLDPVESSTLNYHVGLLVQQLSNNSPVLWVVVDGLGWLDHMKLLEIISEKTSLKVESPIKPYLSILPTKTEYAKWSLYAQLLPEDTSWTDNAGDAFVKVKDGKRYTDANRHKLIKDLTYDPSIKIYCWDSDRFDKLFHSERDWQSFHQVRRTHELEGIAKEIEYFFNKHPRPEDLKVVISSDHGQVIGSLPVMDNIPNNITPKGRMAIGNTQDPRFAVLEAARYGLPHDISVVRDAVSLRAFNNTLNETIGSHGGLFPEEVVIGVSVLSKAAQWLPVIVECHGEGRANETGEILLTVDNPNKIALTNLILYIKEVPELVAGQFIGEQVLAQCKTMLKVKISSWPELGITANNNKLLLSGRLEFCFANLGTSEAKLSSQSSLTVRQLFKSEMNIDDFLN